MTFLVKVIISYFEFKFAYWYSESGSFNNWSTLRVRNTLSNWSKSLDIIYIIYLIIKITSKSYWTVEILDTTPVLLQRMWSHTKIQTQTLAAGQPSSHSYALTHSQCRSLSLSLSLSRSEAMSTHTSEHHHGTAILKEIAVDYCPEVCLHTPDADEIHITFDHRGGARWRSHHRFQYGTFGGRIKCPAGNTSGLNFNIYLSSLEGDKSQVLLLLLLLRLISWFVCS